MSEYIYSLVRTGRDDPTKLLIGQVAIVFGIVIGAMWGATQWAAAMLGYQLRLGAAWFSISDHPVYLP